MTLAIAEQGVLYSVVNMSTFDDFALDYEAALKRNLKLIPGGVDYYYMNRVRVTRRIMQNRAQPSNILDFGAGVGLTIPHLASAFPSASITACDESRESIAALKKRHPFVRTCELDEIPPRHFDLIFVAGVIHHVPPPERHRVIERFRLALRPGGILMVFELNPLNPVTRFLVRECPFDEDANLVSKRILRMSFTRVPDFELLEEGFMVFMPPALKMISQIEGFLRWCPLGAQYYLAMSTSKTAN